MKHVLAAVFLTYTAGASAQAIAVNVPSTAVVIPSVHPTTVAAAGGPQVVEKITFPLEAAAPTYSTVVQTFDSPYGTRKNQVVTTGWNADQSKAGEPVWVTSHESDFCPWEGTCLSEWHLAWTNGATAYRFLSFSGNRVDNSATGYIQTGVFSLRGIDNRVYESVDMVAGNPIHYLYHGTSFISDTNNVAIFRQKNAAGTSSIDTFKINASDELELVPAGQAVAWNGAAHGYLSTASGAYAFAPGKSSIASGASATALGEGSVARLPGQVTQEYLNWTTPGQSQYSLLTETVIVNDANDAEFLIGRTARATMQAGVAYAVKVNVVMAEYGTVLNVAQFTGDFTATMTAGGVSTARINASTADFALTAGYTNIAAPLTMYAKADTTNGAITLWVHPPAGNTKTYFGTAKIEWVEISYN